MRSFSPHGLAALTLVEHAQDRQRIDAQAAINRLPLVFCSKFLVRSLLG